ncbi:MAG: thiosulfate sulfurtransferase [Desulfocapsa sp.]|nr:thiosulfate sulfurtransferase [Desulfocapsa sp.]MBN4058629.1 thiosulfate sulfurtransferase [Desulfocapsa sp. AH-315-J15]
MKKKSVLLTAFILIFLCATDHTWAQESFQVIDTARVAAIREKPEWIIVDTRLNDAFNGWKLDGVVRGGHIQGAVDFSANWLKTDHKNLTAELQDILTTKKITPEKHIVLYDANGQDAEKVAGFLQTQGFSKLYLYDVKQWAEDAGLPMEKYVNYQYIVPAIIVKEILDGKQPESFADSAQIKIIEASWGEEKTSYSKGHIPSSFHINTDRIEPPTTSKPVMWMLADQQTLTTFALDFGFTKNDTVIVTSEEPLAAFRVATVLQYIGVKDVRVLNGGILAWTMAGYQLETNRHDPISVTDFGGPIPGNPDVIDTMEETKAGLLSPESFTLVDNRTWQEHIGQSSGYSYHKRKGRIPGAVFGYAGKTDAYAMDYYRNPDKTMRNADAFLALWQQQGIDTTKHLSFMCGSGWRAAEVYYYATVYGLADIGIYSDGWIGWSNNASNPIITGVPQK